MFTDIDPDSAVVDHFEKFLGVPMVSREILQADTDRVAYFDACRIAGHLFLDPTTGLRLSGTKKKPALPLWRRTGPVGQRPSPPPDDDV